MEPTRGNEILIRRSFIELSEWMRGGPPTFSSTSIQSPDSSWSEEFDMLNLGKGMND
jgi:hypothetical protein